MPLTRSAPLSIWNAISRASPSGCSAHVGVEKTEKRISRRSGQDMAGVLFAAPARRQRRRGQQANAPITAGDLGDNSPRGVLGVVVQHYHLDGHAFARQGSLDRRPDGLLLVAGRDQHGNRGRRG